MLTFCLQVDRRRHALPILAVPYVADWDVDGTACDARLALLLKTAAVAGLLKTYAALPLPRLLDMSACVLAC
jgi:hypothetical protein